MKRLPHTFVRCGGCGHVYNTAFDYAEIPYGDHPNRMFNRGPIWSAHLDRVREIIWSQTTREDPVVVEIGCGAGELLGALHQERPRGTYVGFDPHAPVNTGGPGDSNGTNNEGGPGVTFRREFFEPEQHIAELRPDIIVARHVLEHILDPLSLVQATHVAAAVEGSPCRLFVEVPCIDRCFDTGRTADFFYEHYSHFTTSSFTAMLHHGGSDVESIEHGYGDEVVMGVCSLGSQSVHRRLQETERFHERSAKTRRTVRRQLDRLYDRGLRVALWGGTGKAAMFMNTFGADANRFPCVVDSDPDKVGTFVPGTGQEIRFRDELRARPADVIIITTQWRAREIVAEIERCEISCGSILVEHDGRLVDYHRDAHPYARRAKAAA